MPLPKQMLELTLCLPCDGGCSYCPQAVLKQAYDKRQGLMTSLLFASILKSTPQDVVLSFAGFGEPSQHPDFLVFLGAALSAGFLCHVNTTAKHLTVIDAQYINALRRSSAYNSLTISVHVTRETTGQQRAAIEILDAEKIAPVLRPISRAGMLWENAQHVGTISCGRSPTYSHPVVMPDGWCYLCCCDFGLRHCVGHIGDGFDQLDCVDVRQDNRNSCGTTICRSCEWAATSASATGAEGE